VSTTVLGLLGSTVGTVLVALWFVGRRRPVD
jgi:uncharacterized membrane protein YeaQ/YmgE (transglycosylase-associated protein family)